MHQLDPLTYEINLLIGNFACASNWIVLITHFTYASNWFALICEGFFPHALAFLMNGELEIIWNIISIFNDDFLVFESLEHSSNFV